MWWSNFSKRGTIFSFLPIEAKDKTSFLYMNKLLKEIKAKDEKRDKENQLLSWMLQVSDGDVPPFCIFHIYIYIYIWRNEKFWKTRYEEMRNFERQEGGPLFSLIGGTFLEPNKK